MQEAFFNQLSVYFVFFKLTGLNFKCSMSPVTSIVRCAVFFSLLNLCDSFSKADESEHKRDPRIPGVEEKRGGWGEKGNFEHVNELDEIKTNQ